MTSAHPDEALLSTYADDELDGPGRGELEAHLVQCRECRTRVSMCEREREFERKRYREIDLGSTKQCWSQQRRFCHTELKFYLRRRRVL